jgi:dTDP-4-dehydrorhamnose 3,5-epimerase
VPFDFRRLDIPEVVLIEPKAFGDERGFFMETYKRSEFEGFGIGGEFVQDNHSRSAKGVLRGLHYQLKPRAQGKLVRCTRGRIFDVAVDIRAGSPTFARWVGIELSDENNRILYVPPGFAHGFVSLTDFSEVIYKCTAEYSSEDERGIAWNDPDIKIDWPVKEPVLSPRDSELPFLKDADNNLIYESAA